MKLTTGYKRYATIILAIGFASLLGCSSTASKQGTREASADEIINNKVIKAINGEATLKAAQIKVDTSKGVVLLTGFVNSVADENTATELARYIEGVTLVRDGIQIK
ncbi:MAG: BON domain-containing protein [Gallionella sp.]|jgi:osmotically-inducible protein OsmY